MTNRYEDKQVARRERCEAVAGKNAALSAQHHAAKPGEAIRKLLKAHGFKWSPGREGQRWVRNFNNAGLYHTSVVREEFDAMTSEQA